VLARILIYILTTQKWKKTAQKICWQIFRNSVFVFYLYSPPIYMYTPMHVYSAKVGPLGHPFGFSMLGLQAHTSWARARQGRRGTRSAGISGDNSGLCSPSSASAASTCPASLLSWTFVEQQKRGVSSLQATRRTVAANAVALTRAMPNRLQSSPCCKLPGGTRYQSDILKR
jgi:hypothetical protein